MRPIRMTIGDRHLVRIDAPGVARVTFQPPPAPALQGFPSHAEHKRRAGEAAAQVLKPFSPHLLCLALAALILAATATGMSLDRLDRQIELAERV